jgi:excinuclease ABC subunit C
MIARGDLIAKLQERVHDLPEKPGVYLFKDHTRRIIYVGKAKSLNKRVRSYFTAGRDIKTRILVDNASDVEVIVTKNEYDALLLENTLIKQWNPRFNINLKDGKSYPVIRITADKWPRVFRTRRLVFDGSSYYGPYPQAGRLDLYLNLVDKLFPLRKCRGPLKPRRHPCLYYHIGRCTAPCARLTTQEEYAANVEKIRKLLGGRVDELVKDLEAAMHAASARMDYEKAAVIRDQVRAIRDLTPDNQVVDVVERAHPGEDRDYLGFAGRENWGSFVILQVRDGQMTGKEVYRSEVYSSDEEAIVEFLLQYYGKHPDSGRQTVQVHLPLLLKDQSEDLAATLAEIRRGVRPLDLRFPQRGKHRKILALATENAEQDVLLHGEDHEATSSLEDLRSALELPRVPRRIEGFDIAHLGGTDTVASMVSFAGGRPEKSAYRHFNLRSLKGRIDDYAAMREIVARRYMRVINEKLDPPDLILVDGGKGQVSAARSVLESLGLGDIPLAGLAKENEEIYRPGVRDAIVLDRSSRALRLLQAVRDESHRFATSFQRRKRTRRLSHLTLEEVSGIGRKRSLQLLERFGSVEAIADTSPEELAREARVSQDTAVRLLAFLKERLSEKQQTTQDAGALDSPTGTAHPSQ